MESGKLKKGATAGRKGGGPKKKPVTQSVKAGVQCPVGRIGRYLKKGRYARRVGSGDPKQLSKHETLCNAMELMRSKGKYFGTIIVAVIFENNKIMVGSDSQESWPNPLDDSLVEKDVNCQKLFPSIPCNRLITGSGDSSVVMGVIYRHQEVCFSKNFSESLRAAKTIFAEVVSEIWYSDDWQYALESSTILLAGFDGRDPKIATLRYVKAEQNGETPIINVNLHGSYTSIGTGAEFAENILRNRLVPSFKGLSMTRSWEVAEKAILTAMKFDVYCGGNISRHIMQADGQRSSYDFKFVNELEAECKMRSLEIEENRRHIRFTDNICSHIYFTD